MKAIYAIIVFSISILLSSCDRKETSETRIVLQNLYSTHQYLRSDALFLKKISKNDSIWHIYIGANSEERKDTIYSFLKPLDNDSLLYFFDYKCPIKSKRTFKIHNKDYEVFKYYYDLVEANDEEANYYYHENYGFLLCYSKGWGFLANTIEQDDVSKALIDSIINDKTGFYDGYHPN
ncbi:hypothetical protein [Persicobacter diffluens]|uniref:Lipoprotein n=1 Tax=Persicobacter diffluens TaxID=981 RepID=A0AAN4W670_9BACT|nr:hypothetical protein PEDI_54020 [Persicobacter diffluens]